jgi:hypothetical protein
VADLKRSAKKRAMDELPGIFLWFILPILLGIVAIALPFRTYEKKRLDGALTLGVINSVFCGLAVLTLVGTLVFDWYPTFLPHLIIAVGLLASFVLALRPYAQK